MKRMQSSIEELKYTEVLYAKFDLVQEYILQKNIHGASTVLREISKALDNSNKQSKILLEKRESRGIFNIIPLLYPILKVRDLGFHPSFRPYQLGGFT